jgi:ATP-dependent 26S proteasome regulatory subunit
MTHNTYMRSPARGPAVRLLREELYHLQEPGSYVGEVVKAMGKTKVLVKVSGLPGVVGGHGGPSHARVGSQWRVLVAVGPSGL